ncbi:hypothetical protein [Paenibacillus sp. GCM10028914]|uniref:hypothetical protein n=1 Tax=Paenibacillus sp. GCM10028914 TaxID=3273416 RepID=UPI0036225D4E
MPDQYHGTNSDLQFPNSILNINRKHVPALLSAMHLKQQDMIAEQLAGTDYALPLLIAVEAAQQWEAELAEAAQHWSPPLSLDLSLCSIDCAEEYIHTPERRRLLHFWFYSEDAPADWMEGYSKHFFDFSVIIDADLLTLQKVSGPSR